MARIAGELDHAHAHDAGRDRLDNRDGAIVPGSFVEVTLTCTAPVRVECRPRRWSLRGKKPLVAVVDASAHVHYRPVVLAGDDGKLVRIESGRRRRASRWRSTRRQRGRRRARAAGRGAAGPSMTRASISFLDRRRCSRSPGPPSPRRPPSHPRRGGAPRARPQPVGDHRARGDQPRRRARRAGALGFAADA